MQELKIDGYYPDIVRPKAEKIGPQLKNTLKNCVFSNKKSSNANKNYARELMGLTAIAEDSIALANDYIKQITVSYTHLTLPTKRIV